LRIIQATSARVTTKIASFGKGLGCNNCLRKTIASCTLRRASDLDDTRTTAQRYGRMGLCMPLIAGASLYHGLPGLRKKNDGKMCSYNLIRRTVRTYLKEDVEPGRHWINGLQTDVSSPEGNDQSAVRPWRSALPSPSGGEFRHKTKPATRKGRRASLSIQGQDREVYKLLRWTKLRGLLIKLDRTTRATSSRPRPNGRRN
jgi:hypothetical protein